MRFRDIAGLVDLPIDAVEYRFRNEPVLTVLPVRGAIAGRDALLIAMATELALVIADPERHDQWTTYLAPWHAVRLGDLHSAAGIHRLTVHIDRLMLVVQLWGAKGERALRDFALVAGAEPESLPAAT